MRRMAKLFLVDRETCINVYINESRTTGSSQDLCTPVSSLQALLEPDDI